MNDMHFKNAGELADWLESLHETTEDGAILANRKWEPAQVAAMAIRNMSTGAID